MQSFQHDDPDIRKSALEELQERARVTNEKSFSRDDHGQPSAGAYESCGARHERSPRRRIRSQLYAETARDG
jgi:hypothetical protein